MPMCLIVSSGYASVCARQLTPDGLAALTEAQARFAQDHEAVAVLPAENGRGSVFLYHESPWATYRWLVERDGRAGCADRFFKAA
jgi:hypothetical protein